MRQRSMINATPLGRLPVKHGVAIGILTTLLALLLLLVKPAAQSGAPSWSEPVNLGAPINSPFQENRVVLATDGLSLYFSSTRPCGDGDVVLDTNLWVARRSASGMPWQIQCLRINLDGYFDSAPDLLPDGRWLYFVSDRPGSTSIQRDIWVSRRDDVRDDQGWGAPVNLGSPVNTNAPEIRLLVFRHQRSALLPPVGQAEADVR